MLGQRMDVRGSEIDGHLDRGIESFEDEHEGDGEDDHRPFNPADAQPKSESAGDDADEQLDAGIALRAQQVADSDERKIKGARDFCGPRSAGGFKALGKHRFAIVDSRARFASGRVH